MGQIDDPLSLNLYTYVQNNPLKWIDPSGHVKGSVVDYLEGIGRGSSFDTRAELALQYGIVDRLSQYTGTATQNAKLLSVLKSDFGDKYDDQWDDLYDRNITERGRGSEAKKRE
ncbi:hypothetical protein M5X00_03505 [Paenibacillus alvei]|uniref:RHS repeat-associated core domain-containing protein n=1 Tax=Paenibacillus alvei TaxID=44250 RepID=A0ABT4H6A8_PAEAL|nr:hypothetical protein [Paenibacillus alvei]EJW17263.1 hypothetical protein PAV_4c03660 [Paenibacillus alvei DSM 29]MCY9542298.1 hypothetical protein [Paenibacillus alvei]MCY9705400.1 hypothetical protein [Paenibacillus alvei]MCY9735125.1 hypothetical protein [Paenibacillus alvei]MCY9753330.1 hypothetical protein [Paenibacillus alvei]